jgi:hypothetical protein
MRMEGVRTHLVDVIPVKDLDGAHWITTVRFLLRIVMNL